jgi:hypothetical protein
MCGSSEVDETGERVWGTGEEYKDGLAVVKEFFRGNIENLAAAWPYIEMGLAGRRLGVAIGPGSGGVSEGVGNESAQAAGTRALAATHSFPGIRARSETRLHPERRALRVTACRPCPARV